MKTDWNLESISISRRNAGSHVGIPPKLPADAGLAPGRSFGSPGANPEETAHRRVPTRLLDARELLAPAPADAVSTYVMESPAPETRPGFPAPNGDPATTALRGLSRRVFARAIAYMEANLGENFSLNDLATAAGVSRFHFARLFRVSTGESPMNYCLRLRVERAKRMLIDGNCRMCEVAVELGFFDQSHFSRTFRRITGVSPGEYVRMAEVAEVAF